MFITLAKFSFACAQDQSDIQIANEYLLKGEKEKALKIYESLVKNPENATLIHNNYFTLLLELEKYKEAESYVEHQIKLNPTQVSYRVDLGIIYLKTGDQQKADRYLRSVIRGNADDVFHLKMISDYLAMHNLVDYAEYSLLEARKATHNPSQFCLEMANLYRLQNKQDKMVEEYLNYVTQTPGNNSYIKNLLQVLLAKPEELESLERLLYDKVQQNPNSEVYADLLVWVNLQEKNFYGAFIQARAFDKRFHKETSKTLEIAQITLNNRDYENADKSFTYVVKEFVNTPDYLPARLGLIQTREAKVKKTYPVNNDSVKYLIKEYNLFITEYPDNPNSHEARLNEALLYAYYLDQKDSAIRKLDVLIDNNHVSSYLKARAKLELGDIYLLMEEPWESTLLYSQVEKTERETSLGYEAKLRNAKLSYYKGDFKLAQEHLDILKQATTREIANDAMDLSMRIKENIAFDSTGAALRKFATIELLLYQNKISEAMTGIRTLKKEEGDQDSTVSHGLSSTILDDLYWLEANLRMKQGEFEQALALLQRILDNFGEDILADDAYFLQGEIYEEQLHNKNKAMEIYREFLNRFPGSVHAAEARKRFRQLRGDALQ